MFGCQGHKVASNDGGLCALKHPDISPNVRIVGVLYVSIFWGISKRTYVPHFLGSMPSGGLVSNVLALASSQFVVNTVPLDST